MENNQAPTTPNPQNGKKSHKKALPVTKNICFVGIAVALNVVCAYISIPTVVPFTLQTFAVFFTLAFLGGRLGTLTILIYELLGIAGVPVFSGFGAGIAAFAGPTGGYLIGFQVAALLYLLFEILFKDRLTVRIAACSLGLLLCYAVGTIWFALVYSKAATHSVLAILTTCIIPYIIPDALKITLALFLSTKLRKALKFPR